MMDFFYFQELSCWHIIGIIILTWCIVVEIPFTIWFFKELKRSQKILPPPNHSFEELTWIFKRTVKGDLGRIVPEWLQPVTHSFSRDNILNLMSVNFFYKNIDELTEDERTWLEEMIDYTVKNHKFLIRNEPNSCTPLRYALDPVEAYWRPLIIYLGVMFLNKCVGTVLWILGFEKFMSTNGIVYWYRSTKPSKIREGVQNTTSLLQEEVNGDDTVVLFHGVGVGFLPYLHVVSMISSKTIFLFEMPWIASNPFAKPVHSKDFVESVAHAMAHHGERKASFVGHSFGSIAAAWVHRQKPDLVDRLVLIDPVCLLLCLPDVAIKFLYSENHNTISGKLIREFVSRELSVNRTMRRHFWWTEAVMWPEMLPENSTVILSEYDHIVPTREIYLEMCEVADKVPTYFLPKTAHGGILYSFKPLMLLRNVINDRRYRNTDFRTKPN